MATWSNSNFRNSASPLLEPIIYFHDHTFIILNMVTILVGYIMTNMNMNKFDNRFLLENQLIELIWTIIQTITLIFIALPSLKMR